jgi:hypothetical protein
MNDTRGIADDKSTWWRAALLLRGQTATDQRNLRAFSIWCYVYGAAISAVILFAHFLPEISGPLAWLLATVPVVFGIAALRSFLRYLRGADEFVRKVQLEGIAVGFAAGSIFCMGYFALELFGAPKLPIIVATLPMGLGWVIGALLVASRHR